VYLAQGVITNSVLSWSFISDLTLGLTHGKISSVTVTGRIRNTHFSLSIDWTYPQGMAKCCPPISRELGMFPVHKMHIFHLINKQCTVMPGWYRTLIGGYLQPVEQILWPNAHHELGFPSSNDAFFIFTSSGIQHFFFLGPTKLVRFSATVCLSQILQFTYEVYQEQTRWTVMEPLLKIEEIQWSRWFSIKILFGYFINHTAHLLYYVPIIVTVGNKIFLAHT